MNQPQHSVTIQEGILRKYVLEPESIQHASFQLIGNWNQNKNRGTGIHDSLRNLAMLITSLSSTLEPSQQLDPTCTECLDQKTLQVSTQASKKKKKSFNGKDSTQLYYLIQMNTSTQTLQFVMICALNGPIIIESAYAVCLIRTPHRFS